MNYFCKIFASSIPSHKITHIQIWRIDEYRLSKLFIHPAECSALYLPPPFIFIMHAHLLCWKYVSTFILQRRILKYLLHAVHWLFLFKRIWCLWFIWCCSTERPTHWSSNGFWWITWISSITVTRVLWLYVAIQMKPVFIHLEMIWGSAVPWRIFLISQLQKFS